MIHTSFHDNYVVDWTNSGESLAVAGKVRETPCPADHSFRFQNEIQFFSDEGATIYSAQIPSEKVRKLTERCGGLSYQVSLAVHSRKLFFVALLEREELEGV